MLHLVTAVIQPFRLEVVKDALRDAGAAGMTVTEVSGFGRQGSHTETYRGAEYEVDFVPKLKIEILCTAEESERVADLIAEAARTGKIGDGKVWIAPIGQAIRIRTGELGTEAV